MYLHELCRINRKTKADQEVGGGQPDSFRAQPFTPVAAVAAYDILDVILIDRTVGVTDGVAVAFFFVCCYDLPLVLQRDLGVWHKGRKKNGVCMPAFRAFQSQDAGLLF